MRGKKREKWKSAMQCYYVEFITVCDSQTVLELCLDSKFVEPYVDLWPSTMYQYWSYSNTRKQHQVFDHSSLQDLPDTDR